MKKKYIAIGIIALVLLVFTSCKDYAKIDACKKDVKGIR